MKIPCPFLGHPVFLALSRLQHIFEQHPDMPDTDFTVFTSAIEDPDQVRRDRDTSALKFVRRIADEHLVIVVLHKQEYDWVWTAYFTDVLSRRDEVLWNR